MKALVGVDVFLDWDEGQRDPETLANQLNTATASADLSLQMITNRGVKVWPEGFPETFCTDHWRCRFVSRTSPGQDPVSHTQILKLLQAIADQGLDFIKTEHLCTFDGEAGYSLGQGQ